MKKKGFPVFIIFILLSTLGYAGHNTLYQVSTLSALQEGVYDGITTLKELKAHGDFGLGTFEGLDGEMVFIDGNFYQVKSDGKVYTPGLSVRSPFAMVTFFERDKAMSVKMPGDMEKIQALVIAMLPSKNIPCAVRLDGNFTYVKTRSVPAQAKPYPRLAEVVKNQPTFEMKNVKGTIIGYYLPDYYKGINMAGFHLHFITGDRKSGGHLLACNLTEGDLAVDYSYSLNLILPENGDFYKIDLSRDEHKELEKIEK